MAAFRLADTDLHVGVLEDPKRDLEFRRLCIVVRSGVAMHRETGDIQCTASKGMAIGI